MPITLNGTYWSIEEVSEALGIVRSSAAIKIKEWGNGVVYIGKNRFLIEDSEYQKLIEYQKILAETKSLKAVANILQTSPRTIETMVEKGLPVIEVQGEKRLALEWVSALKKAIKETRKSKEVKVLEFSDYTLERAKKIFAKENVEEDAD